jgi:hypothetical protein
MDPDASVTMLTGISAGGKRAHALEAVGIKTIRDLASNNVNVSGCAKARIQAITICAAAVPKNPNGPQQHPRQIGGATDLTCSWTGLRAHVWAEPGVLVRCTIIGAVMTPAGVCALVKFLRHGKVQHRAVTFQYLTSVAIQHTIHACETDDEERITTAAVGVDLSDTPELNVNMMQQLRFNRFNMIGDAATAFIIREVEDIAQIR